jgi:hypothetical protein
MRQERVYSIQPLCLWLLVPGDDAHAALPLDDAQARPHVTGAHLFLPCLLSPKNLLPNNSVETCNLTGAVCRCRCPSS